MNNKEVYINGQLCVIDEAKNPIQLVYAINDLAELKDRQAYSTNTFKIPANPTNLAICGFPNNPNLIQTQPYRKLSGKIAQDGIEILPNGVALITGSGAFIEVQILAGLIGFFDLLADKNIQDLDLSAYDHVWNLATVAGSQGNTEGYLYPVVDYGYQLNPEQRETSATRLRPATFRKTIIEKIISEAGYTASGAYLTYPKYLNSLVMFSNDKFEHGKAYTDMLDSYKASARKTTPEAFDAFNTTRAFIVFQDDAATDPSNSWSGDRYTSPSTMNVTVTLKYSLEQYYAIGYGQPGEFLVTIQRRRAASADWIEIASTRTTMTNTGGPQAFNDQILEVVAELNTGDQLRVYTIKARNRVIAVMKQGSSITFTPVASEVIYGSDVQLAATLPSISQKNFFKDFLQNFGLIAVPDNYNKTLQLINMEEVYANKPIAEDITAKLYDSEDDISYALSGYGVNNIGEYKEDEAVPDALGNGVMVFDNLTLETTKTIFTSVFAATITINRFGGLNVAQIRKIENGEESLAFSIKTEPRILLDRKINTDFKFEDGNGEITVNAISLPLFDGLDYQTLFDENYPEILRMLYRPFVVSKKILLKNTDIAAINWTIPVYDKKTASYYYKNQITYLQGDVSTINLIRMP